MLRQSDISCGVFELFDLLPFKAKYENDKYIAYQQSIEEYLIDTFYRCEEENDVGQPAFIIFSDIYLIKPKSNGEIVANFVEENKLGEIHRSIAKRNPNTGNRIRVYLWNVNWRNYSNWIDKQESTHVRRNIYHQSS